MKFNWTIEVGDIIAFASFIGAIIMFILTLIKQKKSESNAISANDFHDAAKKYYDMMVEYTPHMFSNVKNVSSEEHKALCDANVVKIGRNKWILKIYNKGNSNARDVNFTYLNEGSPNIIGELPIPLLEPQKNVDFHFLIHLGIESRTWEYTVSWKNEDGSLSDKKGILTLPLS